MDIVLVIWLKRMNGKFIEFLFLDSLTMNRFFDYGFYKLFELPQKCFVTLKFTHSLFKKYKSFWRTTKCYPVESVFTIVVQLIFRDEACTHTKHPPPLKGTKTTNPQNKTKTITPHTRKAYFTYHESKVYFVYPRNLAILRLFKFVSCLPLSVILLYHIIHASSIQLRWLSRYLISTFLL